MTTPGVFTLQASDGLRIAVTDAGAAWMSCVVPVDGVGREVLLGHATPADCLVQPGYLGAIVGRYANRIAGACFDLDGQHFPLQANEGEHQLHGGADGFHRRLWDVVSHTDDRLELALVSPDGDQGFPGELSVRAVYRVEPPLTVTVTLEATTTAPTLCNLTSHAYFNLDGDAADIRGHRLQIAADRYLPVRADLIPTGEQAGVAGTPFDFRTPRRIGDALDALAGATPRCHDHCWLDGNATLQSGDGRLALELRSAAPGLQFYAGEFLPRTPDRQGRPYAAHAGLALEPQALPDSPHHPEWPQPGAVLRPGEVYRHQITYRFTPAPPTMSNPTSSPARWTPEQAHAWFKAQPWALGANFVPASAINQLAMWQAETFDPERIDLELGWAKGLGMNTMRVFLHDLLWSQDAAGFKQRIGQYLDIAERHGIFTMFVLFDSCWDPEPKLGPQREPIPGVHNSGWVQSPSAAQLADRATWPQLRAYVEDIVRTFGQDKRVTYWDIWNEPDNQGGGMGYYLPREAKNKIALVAEMIPQAFAWARAQNPMQPLTSGVWLGDNWAPDSPELNAVQKAQLACSDVVSFHDYNWPEKFEMRIRQLQQYGRPLICTEYMARSLGSTFDIALPIAAREDIGMINWGFVDGKSQTKMPWDSWQRPYTIHPPLVWFHDVLHTDGTPYRQREAELLRHYGSRQR